MMPNDNDKVRYPVGQDLATGRFIPEPAYNTAVLTVSGSTTSTGAIATLSLPAGARALILRVVMANEGSSGAAAGWLVAGTSNLHPLYLPSPGVLELKGDLLSPVAVVNNTTTSALSVSASISSNSASNTVGASINYMIMPDTRPAM